MVRIMAKKKDPEILAKIETLQRQIQALVQEFKVDADAADAEDQATRATIREPLDAALVDRVRIMLQDRPMLFTEIVAATEEKENTIKAVLTKMQRDDELLINIGQANKARWFIFAPRVASRVVGRLLELGVRGSTSESQRA
jgi:hypothetical protein